MEWKSSGPFDLSLILIPKHFFSVLDLFFKFRMWGPWSTIVSAHPDSTTAEICSSPKGKLPYYLGKVRWGHQLHKSSIERMNSNRPATWLLFTEILNDALSHNALIFIYRAATIKAYRSRPSRQLPHRECPGNHEANDKHSQRFHPKFVQARQQVSHETEPKKKVSWNANQFLQLW